jgi:2'-hydroxyisoflavone reductase
MTTRREVLQLGAGAVTLSVAGASHSASEPAAKKLDLLVLGGTGFIGPHQIESALARGHRVTVFNRGRRAGLFGGRVEELVGDRDARVGDGLKALAGTRSWDAVIDNSGYVPRHVRDSAELLQGRVGRYLYISTVAVYDFEAATHFTEAGPLAALEDPTVEEVNNKTYGPLKAECDRLVRQMYGDGCTVVRPTYIVGPGDSSDRFTYWVDRIHRGGDVLTCAHPDYEIAWVDVRDLCNWLVEILERDLPGTFNSSGPASSVTRAGLMWGLRAMTAAPVNFHWPNDELLAELKIAPPMLGAPPRHFANAASIAAGHQYRALVNSARDTLAWWQAQPPARRATARGWISSAQEREAIARLTS